jgi:hypothetical protein
MVRPSLCLLLCASWMAATASAYIIPGAFVMQDGSRVRFTRWQCLLASVFSLATRTIRWCRKQIFGAEFLTFLKSICSFVLWNISRANVSVSSFHVGWGINLWMMAWRALFEFEVHAWSAQGSRDVFAECCVWCNYVKLRRQVQHLQCFLEYLLLLAMKPFLSSQEHCRLVTHAIVSSKVLRQ